MRAAHRVHYTVTDNHVDPAHSVQLGVGGNPIVPRKDPTHSDLGYKLIPAEGFHQLGIERTAEIIRARIADTPLYITFDVDVLDPAEAPAVSNMEPMQRGLRAWE